MYATLQTLRRSRKRAKQTVTANPIEVTHGATNIPVFSQHH